MGSDAADLIGVRGRERVKARGSAALDLVDAVERQCVEVGMEVRGGGPEPLDEGDGSALAVARSVLSSNLAGASTTLVTIDEIPARGLAPEPPIAVLLIAASAISAAANRPRGA